MADKKYFKTSRIQAKLNSYLKEAKQEYAGYKKTGDTTRLAEAGEELWGAFNYLMELRVQKSLKTAKEVIEATYASHDNTLIGIYQNAFALHQFFYGWTDRIEDIERAYQTTEKGIEIYRSNLNHREGRERKKLAYA